MEHPNNTSKKEEPVSIELVAETAEIHKEKRITGKVEIIKDVLTERKSIPLVANTTDYVTDRVPINKVVDAEPDIRWEGDTMIVPVVREEEIVVKRLVLVEEIHLQRRTSESTTHEEVTLRREVAEVQRT